MCLAPSAVTAVVMLKTSGTRVTMDMSCFCGKDGDYVLNEFQIHEAELEAGSVCRPPTLSL